jgi:hypothetical protein
MNIETSVRLDQKMTGLVGAELLPPPKTPLLIISNHSFTGTLLPNLLRVKHYRPDLTIMANAGFEPVLNLLGLDTIAVNSMKHKPNGNLLRNLWATAIRASGSLSGSYKNSYKGMQLIDKVVETLKEGNAVWITPSASNEIYQHQEKWHIGLGYIVSHYLQSDRKDLKIALLEIQDKKIARVNKVMFAAESVNCQQNPKIISAELHKIFFATASSAS